MFEEPLKSCVATKPPTAACTGTYGDHPKRLFHV